MRCPFTAPPPGPVTTRERDCLIAGLFQATTVAVGNRKPPILAKTTMRHAYAGRCLAPFVLALMNQPDNAFDKKKRADPVGPPVSLDLDWSATRAPTSASEAATEPSVPLRPHRSDR